MRGLGGPCDFGITQEAYIVFCSQPAHSCNPHVLGVYCTSSRQKAESATCFHPSRSAYFPQQAAKGAGEEIRNHLEGINRKLDADLHITPTDALVLEEAISKARPTRTACAHHVFSAPPSPAR